MEVGTGFHPELSGRENIFLNGAILGMTRTEIQRKFDEIVAFAEVEKFLDTPVKRYSSGMYVRLAFAVAAHLEPEILMVDEVLAVGDAAFQRKCMSKMGQVAEGGRTVLFVSHNMAAISRLCGRALWFDQGQLRESGDAEKVVASYLAFGTEEAGEIIYNNNGHKGPGSDYVRLEAIRVRGSDGTVTPTLDVRRPFTLEVQYRVLKCASNLRVGVQINSQDGTAILATTDMDSQEELVREPGVYTSCCKLPGEFLNHGQYYLAVGCDFPTVQTRFHVTPPWPSTSPRPAAWGHTSTMTGRECYGSDYLGGWREPAYDGHLPAPINSLARFDFVSYWADRLDAHNEQDCSLPPVAIRVASGEANSSRCPGDARHCAECYHVFAGSRRLQALESAAAS